VRLNWVTPHPLLAPYIEKLWVFESGTGIPPDDMRTKFPDGLIKMVLSCRGALSATRNGLLIRRYPEGSIYLAGQMDRPVRIDSSGPTGAIGIEFKPASAYRFFPFPLIEIKNTVVLGSEALGRTFQETLRRIQDCATIEGKLSAVQRYLLGALDASGRPDMLVEWAVGKIQESQGMMRMSDLCRQSGYSERHVELRFAERVGMSPKALARIQRFLPLIKAYLGRRTSVRFDDALDRYYDRSHFVREFRQFTGLSPRGYQRSRNEFGEIFHRGG